jgi:ankyrin repeat protein
VRRPLLCASQLLVARPLTAFLSRLARFGSSRNHAEMAKLLIAQKARVDAADYTGGATALMLAARNGSLAAVEALVEAVRATARSPVSPSPLAR